MLSDYGRAARLGQSRDGTTRARMIEDAAGTI
jgi:hypothetical protein